MGRGKGEVVVMNDEAHHCYQDKPLGVGEKCDRQAEVEVESARVWFRGLHAVQKRVGTTAIYDLPATPFYLAGSGSQQGCLFPWTVRDFSLMTSTDPNPR